MVVAGMIQYDSVGGRPDMSTPDHRIPEHNVAN